MINSGREWDWMDDKEEEDDMKYNFLMRAIDAGIIVGDGGGAFPLSEQSDPREYHYVHSAILTQPIQHIWTYLVSEVVRDFGDTYIILTIEPTVELSLDMVV